MANKENGRYALAEPGSGLTVFSMEGGEFNLFGSSYTAIEVTEKKKYGKINDEPTSLEVVDNTETMLAVGLEIAAGFAILAVATVLTGGAALAVCALAGASIGTAAATMGMYESDKKTGYNRSWGEFGLGVLGGAVIGGMAGAMTYGTLAAAPAAGTIAGLDAQYFLGMSAFTQNVVPAIITTGVNGLAFTTWAYTINDIYASNGGYNIILDKVFDNNADKYGEFGMMLYTLSGAVEEYVATNMFRLGGGQTKQGIQFENSESSSKADVLAQNRANGRAFEQQEFAKFSSQNNNAVEQITVKTSSGVRTRVDAIGLDANGNVVINEYKSSLTAPLTDNQKIAFPEIFESGATVVGKGKGIFSGGYQIPPGTKVTIIRPE